ncbi:phage holin, lambda family [Aeromonas hydrophila]|uniref:phage holin, lambda family n=1 Tax=Aeromonas hydrophila TaxID=644 RepID=UPI003D1BB853
MNTMPNKDPMIGAALLVWLMDNWPTLYAVLLTIAIAWLRITYSGGSGRRRLSETLLCGLLWWPCWALLAWLGVPPEFAGALACSIGFFGVDTLRETGKAFINNKTGGPHGSN